MAKRTTHRSSKGTKLYAVRAADGTFKDIQSYKRAHAADMRRTSEAESASASSKGKKKSPGKKVARKKVTKKRTSRRTSTRKKSTRR